MEKAATHFNVVKSFRSELLFTFQCCLSMGQQMFMWQIAWTILIFRHFVCVWHWQCTHSTNDHFNKLRRGRSHKRNCFGPPLFDLFTSRSRLGCFFFLLLFLLLKSKFISMNGNKIVKQTSRMQFRVSYFPISIGNVFLFVRNVTFVKAKQSGRSWKMKENAKSKHISHMFHIVVLHTCALHRC